MKKINILEQVRTLGASLSGIAGVAELRNAPSYRVSSGTAEFPAMAKSVLVLALRHPEAEPELDYWWGHSGGTPGNRKLQEISKQLQIWFNDVYQIQAQPVPYHIERGGIFLKDAAVLAGIGVIGANNLLITPEFGPRVRLRALFLDIEIEPTPPVRFSPCDGCTMPCRTSCPQQAFSSGAFMLDRCNMQMLRDEEEVLILKAVKEDSPTVQIKYCRACELACPVGKTG